MTPSYPSRQPTLLYLPFCARCEVEIDVDQKPTPCSSLRRTDTKRSPSSPKAPTKSNRLPPLAHPPFQDPITFDPRPTTHVGKSHPGSGHLGCAPLVLSSEEGGPRLRHARNRRLTLSAPKIHKNPKVPDDLCQLLVVKCLVASRLPIIVPGSGEGFP